jgi:hypothetical protein
VGKPPTHMRWPVAREVYSRIERLAQGPYLEMFSRQSRASWDALGNQAALFDTGAVRTAGSTTVCDPGRVKTSKGRSRRGIMFYRCRSFRVVLPLLARTLGLEKKAVQRVLHAPAF